MIVGLRLVPLVHVFPDAAFKFYLDATPQERARRRVAQLRSRGEIVDPQEILNQILARDRRDASRAVGPLSIPKDAIVMDTTSLTQAEVVDRIVRTVPSGMREPRQQTSDEQVGQKR